MARPAANDGGVPALPPDVRLAAVVSTYHRDVTGTMLDSAAAVVREAGGGELLTISAPGAFELPIVAQRLVSRSDVHAVLCFGLILRGETSHDRHIARAVAEGLMRVGLESGKPVLFGVLTCDDVGQARRRARTREEGGLDKGREVALAAIGALRALEDAGGDDRPARHELRVEARR